MKTHHFTPSLGNLFTITGHTYRGTSLAGRKNK